MFCPNCAASCPEEQRFCTRCGTDLHPEAGEVIIPQYQEKKGSRWVPILVLCLIAAIGIGVFFATGSINAPVSHPKSLWFSLKDGTLSFNEDMYIGGSELTVPSEIAGQPVLYLADGCFAGCDSLTTVILPDTLQVIEDGAFEDCTALRGIYIPDSVTYIGAEAFSGCTNLEAIVIPAGMEYIGNRAFQDCGQLFYIFYPGSIDTWDTLYTEFINPYTGVYCDEGSFYQGGDPNS